MVFIGLDSLSLDWNWFSLDLDLEFTFIGYGTGFGFSDLDLVSLRTGLVFRIWNWFQRIRIIGLSSDLVMCRINNHNFSGSGIGFISIGTLVFQMGDFIGLSKG